MGERFGSDNGEQGALSEVVLSAEEASAFAPLIEAFTKGIRGIDVDEEVAPATIFRPGKEK